jgi:hypothetical protein
VLSVNGCKINNLADLVRIVDTCVDPYLVLNLDYAQKVALVLKKIVQKGLICVEQHEALHLTSIINPPSLCAFQVVLHTERAKQATSEILATHRIPHDRSSDLLTLALPSPVEGIVKLGTGARGRKKKS